MHTVASADGTTIAFDRVGDGPPLVLVDGALCYRASGPNGPLAAELAAHFTVVTYDRRGRGDSGDTGPYAVEREVEDLAALVETLGGRAFGYGISSGGALVLEAAGRGVPFTKVAVYEVPFVVDDHRPPIPDDYVARMDALVAAGQRADAVRLFMRDGVGLPLAAVAMMRFMPAWSKLKGVAHTLPYETALTAELQRDRPLPTDRWQSVAMPVLVVNGGKSDAWMRSAMQALAQVLPDGRYRTLEGQTHLVKPKVLAPALMEFFTD